MKERINRLVGRLRGNKENGGNGSNEGNKILRRMRRILRRVVLSTAVVVVVILLLFVAVDINLFGLFGRSPGFDDIREPQVNEASLVYSADSVLLGRYYDENRTPASYDELTDTLINTLIDTEDERFYSHHGIDILGIFAATRDAFTGNPRGASTISQQLAKNLFRTRTHYSTGSLGRIPGIKLLIIKMKEMIVATKLEKMFTKEEILTMYLNTVDFGSHSFGINTAARTYFGCAPCELTVEQCATLVGLLKATSTYNPYRNPLNATVRRNLVLANLYNHGHLMVNGRPATRSQFDSICATPLLPSERDNSSGSSDSDLAPYFRQALVDYIATLCRMDMIEGYDSDNMLDINTAGLRIYTTLDTRMQALAEEAVREQMIIIQQRFDDHWRNMNPWQDDRHREIPNFIEDIARRTPRYKSLCRQFGGDTLKIDSLMNAPHPVPVFSWQKGRDTLIMSTIDSIRHAVRFMHTGFVAIEPDTRHVKVWVGDIDWQSWQYDKVLAQRQPGSTFKLFVYAEAMNQGLTPMTTRLDSWHAYPDTVDGKPTVWAPHNANGFFSNLMLPLKSAFAQSINSVAVTLGYEVGAANIASTAHAMGIESDLREVPSIALGASDVNLFELTNAYATAVADGVYAMPIMVARIEDRDGNTIYEAPTPDNDKTRRQAIPYKSAFYMQQLLRGGMTEPGGTVAALWSYIRSAYQHTDFGGKTGTSNNHCDAWFVGTTPGLVGGAWVGGEYRCIHFRTGELGQGSRTALPIFGRFMDKLIADDRFAQYRRHFPAPPADIPVSTYRGYSVYAGEAEEE